MSKGHGVMQRAILDSLEEGAGHPDGWVGVPLLQMFTSIRLSSDLDSRSLASRSFAESFNRAVRGLLDEGAIEVASGKYSDTYTSERVRRYFRVPRA